MSDLVGTVEQVAVALEVSDRTVYRLIENGQLPHVRLAPKTIRIYWSALREWLADESHASTILAELEADGADVPGLSDRAGAA